MDCNRHCIWEDSWSESDESRLGRQRTHACGHNASRRVKIATTTSATNHHHGRTAPAHDKDDGQGARYFAQNPPALASSSRKALHLKALGPLCGALFPGHACTALHGRPCGSEKDRVAQDQLHPSRLIALSLTYHSKLQRSNAHATLSISLKSKELRLIASSFLLSYHTLL